MNSYSRRKQERDEARERARAFENLSKDFARALLRDHPQQAADALRRLAKLCPAWMPYVEGIPAKVAELESKTRRNG